MMASYNVPVYVIKSLMTRPHVRYVVRYTGVYRWTALTSPDPFVHAIFDAIYDTIYDNYFWAAPMVLLDPSPPCVVTYIAAYDVLGADWLKRIPTHIAVRIS